MSHLGMDRISVQVHRWHERKARSRSRHSWLDFRTSLWPCRLSKSSGIGRSREARYACQCVWYEREAGQKSTPSLSAMATTRPATASVPRAGLPVATFRHFAPTGGGGRRALSFCCFDKSGLRREPDGDAIPSHSREGGPTCQRRSTTRRAVHPTSYAGRHSDCVSVVRLSTAASADPVCQRWAVPTHSPGPKIQLDRPRRTRHRAVGASLRVRGQFGSSDRDLLRLRQGSETSSNPPIVSRGRTRR